MRTHKAVETASTHEPNTVPIWEVPGLVLDFGMRQMLALGRSLLSLWYREDRAYRIPFGYLRGSIIGYDHSINLRTMLGLEERRYFDVLLRVLTMADRPHESLVVCDIGANVGLYSLFFSRYLPEDAIIYAFEPGPVAEHLERNLSLNHVGNVCIVDMACSDRIGTAEFFIGPNHYVSSLCVDWAAGGQTPTHKSIVKTTTLDAFFFGAVKRRGPDLIKMDIEGGGTLALTGCVECVKEKKPLLLIESHTPDEDRAIVRLLADHDYQAYRIQNQKWVSALTRTYPDPDGVWGTMLLCPSEMRQSLDTVLA